MNPLVVVLGPTGSGKSALALDLAERFDGEIVNCDSVQLYRGFDVGTAKLPERERRGIPHHLFDILDPSEVFTAGDYARVARPILNEIASKGHLPVVAGGTGFYVRALLEGLFPGPVRQVDLRAGLMAREERQPGFLHRALRRFDPAAARRIHANDKKKVVRALEVCLAERQPISDLHEKRARDSLTGFRVYKIVLNPPRGDLYYKLDQRCAGILEGGIIEEINDSLRQGVSPKAKPFESIGYKESLLLLNGTLTREQALELLRRNTRRYAKRQLTWFRRESEARWFEGFGTDPAVASSVINMLVEFLQNLE